MLHYLIFYLSCPIQPIPLATIVIPLVASPSAHGTPDLLWVVLLVTWFFNRIFTHINNEILMFVEFTLGLRV